MPDYPNLSSLPDAKCLQTWRAFNARMKAAPELGWLPGPILRHDIPALRPQDAPLLVVVKTADDWTRETLGRKARHFVKYDFGMRLYLYAENGTVEQIEAQYDFIEQANEVLVGLLRSEYMACNGAYWQQIKLAGGERNGRTSIINKEKERLMITTRFSLIREFPPGT